MAKQSESRTIREQIEAAYRRKDVATAEAMVRKVIAARPRDLGLMVTLGQLAMRWSCNQQALLRFDAALKLRPDDAGVHMIRGHVLVRLGRVGEGVDALRRARALAGGLGEEVAVGVAQGLVDAGMSAEALDTLLELLQRKPGVGEYTEIMLARLLGEAGRHEEADARFRAVIAANPSSALALPPYAAFLAGTGRASEAEALLRESIAKWPRRAELRGGLVETLFLLHRHDEIVDQCRAIIALEPDSVLPRWALVRAFAALGQLDQARAEERELHRLHPRAMERIARMGAPGQGRPTVDAVPIVPTAESEFVAAWYARLELGDWAHFDERLHTVCEIVDEMDVRGDSTRPSNISPYLALMLPLGGERQLAVARRRAAQIREGLKGRGFRLPEVTRPRKDRPRLRIGYLSADFRNHAVAHLAQHLFCLHDRGRFEVFGYSLQPSDGSTYRDLIEKGCDTFVDCQALSNRAVAERIRADEVDILVDLAAYMRLSRPDIAALRPAPVQVQYLGFAGSSGADWFDYRLVPGRALTELDQALSSECLVRLPGTHIPVKEFDEAAATSRAAHGLPETAFVYCCFHRVDKLDPALFGVWMRVLQAVPESVLWLFEGKSGIRERLRARAVAAGIEPGRLVFADRAPVAEHIARQRLADLFLDAIHFGGSTTLSMAAWAGLPVLTLKGRTEATCSGAVLNALSDCDALTCEDVVDYERKAIELGRDPALARRHRLALEAGRSSNPYFDAAATVRDIEAGYEAMWARFAAGMPPAPIEVERS